MRKLLQLTAILLALSLTACAPSDAPATSSEPPAPESSAPASAQPEASEPETSKEAVSEESEETETLNLTDDQNATYRISCSFDDIGLPYGCGWGLDLTDVFTGESLGVKRDYFFPEVPAHGCKMYRARLVQLP